MWHLIHQSLKRYFFDYFCIPPAPSSKLDLAAFLPNYRTLIGQLILQEPIPKRLTASSWHLTFFLNDHEHLKNVGVRHSSSEGLKGSAGVVWRVQYTPPEPTSNLGASSNISARTGKCFWRSFSHPVDWYRQNILNKLGGGMSTGKFFKI